MTYPYQLDRVLTQLQDEESLLNKVASTHDTSEGSALQHTGGWATLLTILKESGERPPKRSHYTSQSSSASHSAGRGAAHRNLARQPSNGSDSDSVQLAKRFKASNLEGK